MADPRAQDPHDDNPVKTNPPTPHGIPIDAHGLIGNMRTTALVSTQGAIDFMCFPRVDSPTIFGALLDEKRGGAFSIAPAFEIARTKQMYLPETNVLLTRFMSGDAVCELVDFMPVSKNDEEEKGDSNCIVRVVRAKYGDMSVRVQCAPRFDYARGSHEATQADENSIRFAVSGKNETLMLASTIKLGVDKNDAFAQFDLKEGETACFVFGAESELACTELQCKEALSDTIDFWRAWSAKSTYHGRYREVVMRSALLLKLLSSRETGAIVAAPTFGMPETPDGGRRWDYRYTWIRDAAFSVYALLRLGYTGEARNFKNWIAERNKQCDSDGSFRVMYAVDGEEPPDEEAVDTLYGSGTEPPLIGNGARDQTQLDVYGALLDAIYLYNKYGEAISYDGWQHVTRTVNFVAKNWQNADQGIWEFRNGGRPLLHSRLMCWVALDRAIRLAQKRSLPAGKMRDPDCRN